MTVKVETEKHEVLYTLLKVGGVIGAFVFLIEGNFIGVAASGVVAAWANSQEKQS